MVDLTVGDVRPWLPARDWGLSLAFYVALGWRERWSDGNGLALLELGSHRFILQDRYVAAWADNTMLTVEVADADAWYDHARAVVATGAYGDARVAPPCDESFGARVTYVWDPVGVLWHFARFDGPR